MNKIAALLTCHNRKEKTLKCLQSINNTKKIKNTQLDIYLVDDGSIDGTSNSVSKLFSNVKIIQGNGNLFWNRGMHLAWVTAANNSDYDFYFWLNDDTLINNDTIEILLNASRHKKNKSIIVGSTCSFNNHKDITYGGLNHKHGLLYPNTSSIQCDFFNGNIVLIPKYVFDKVGFNDNMFRHALGDFDYGLRASKLGIKSYVAPGFLGKCDLHENLPVWLDPKRNIQNRWKAFKSPLGNNPEEFFLFKIRHYGIFSAIFSYIMNYLRVFIPYLWTNNSDLKFFK